MTEIPTTENYDFPVMSHMTDEELEQETVDAWGDILDHGDGRVETDGLIEPLDSILTGLRTDVDGVDSSLSNHEADTTNPHNVTEQQTGAADSLSDHENDSSNPHNVSNTQVGVTSTSTADGYEITIDGDTYEFIEE